MSLLQKLEDEAHLLLQELNEHVKHQVAKGNKVNETLHEILNHLHAHVNPTSVDSAPAPMAPVVDDAPVSAPVASTPVVEATVVVEAPQTVAQEQSAANKAN
jgi:hypothetical protein